MTSIIVPTEDTTVGSSDVTTSSTNNNDNNKDKDGNKQQVSNDNGLLIYDTIPLVDPSDQYTINVTTCGYNTITQNIVQLVSSSSSYKDVFVLQTIVPYTTKDDASNNKYYSNLINWSHSYSTIVYDPTIIQNIVYNQQTSTNDTIAINNDNNTTIIPGISVQVKRRKNNTNDCNKITSCTVYPSSTTTITPIQISDDGTIVTFVKLLLPVVSDSDTCTVDNNSNTFFNVVIDINCQMETIRTDAIDPPPAERTNHSAGTADIPIHTLSLHGTIPLKNNIPDPTSIFVYNVYPNSSRIVYDNFNVCNEDVNTLYFHPGIHYLGENFQIRSNCNYYIPGDAIVYGTFNNHSINMDATNVLIYGHGTISNGIGFYKDTTKELLHWKVRDYNIPVNDTDIDYQQYEINSYKKRPIDLLYCKGSMIDGITITDPSNNSILMHNPSSSTNNTSDNHYSYVTNCKIFAWRVNSDGGGCNDNSIINNIFYRTQDDSLYPNGNSIKNCTFWTDANGCNLRLSFLPNYITNDSTTGSIDNIQKKNNKLNYNNNNTKKLIIDNVNFLFRHNLWWSDSTCIELPINDSIDRCIGNGVIFSNLYCSDPNPIRPFFKLYVSTNGIVSGIVFQNITINKMPQYKDSISIVKNEFITYNNGIINNILFHNLRIENTIITQTNYTVYFTISNGVELIFTNDMN